MSEGSQIVARQLGRIAFGAVLLGGAIHLALSAVWCAVPLAHRWGEAFHASRIIGWTWVIAIVANFVVSRLAAAARPRRRPEQLFALSLIAPTLGIAALGPITLHMTLVLPLWGNHVFDAWVFQSLIVTGFTHVVFATTSALRAYELVAGKPARTPRSIYVATVVASCVPFVILYAIPPVLVAITALPFVPLLHAMDALVAHERREIAAAVHPLPQATLRVRPSADERHRGDG